MSTRVPPQPLKPSDFHPRKHEKYSPNLHKYIRRQGRFPCEVYRAKDGTLYIGRIENGWLYGTRLWAVLGGLRGLRGYLQSVAYPNVEKTWGLKPVKNFWQRYHQIGRCILDPEHTRAFANAHHRFIETGRTRTCQWCGQKQRRHTQTKIVKTQVWKNMPKAL